MSSNGDRSPLWAQADAYLFDIDGTLLNTRDATHYFAFRNALKAVYGVESDIDGVPVHGNTDIGILRAVIRRAGLPDSTFEERLPEVLQHMADEIWQKRSGIRCELCPSIEDLLQKLTRRGKLLGVASGNLERIGWAKLQAAGLREFFSFGSFSDRAELRVDIFRNGLAEVRRRLGEDARVCFVGDTPSDINAAKALGTPVIAVATGIYGRTELLDLHPDQCVGCCTDLLSHF